jgi:hypothetical protein
LLCVFELALAKAADLCRAAGCRYFGVQGAGPAFRLDKEFGAGSSRLGLCALSLQRCRSGYDGHKPNSGSPLHAINARRGRLKGGSPPFPASGFRDQSILRSGRLKQQI